MAFAIPTTLTATIGVPAHLATLGTVPFLLEVDVAPQPLIGMIDHRGGTEALRAIPKFYP